MDHRRLNSGAQWACSTALALLLSLLVVGEIRGEEPNLSPDGTVPTVCHCEPAAAPTTRKPTRTRTRTRTATRTAASTPSPTVTSTSTSNACSTPTPTRAPAPDASSPTPSATPTGAAVCDSCPDRDHRFEITKYLIVAGFGFAQTCFLCILAFAFLFCLAYGGVWWKGERTTGWERFTGLGIIAAAAVLTLALLTMRGCAGTSREGTASAKAIADLRGDLGALDSAVRGLAAACRAPTDPTPGLTPRSDDGGRPHGPDLQQLVALCCSGRVDRKEDPEGFWNSRKASLAALFGALLTGLLSLTTVVVSKEDKVSEFRNEWLNDLRIEMGKLLGLIELIVRLIKPDAADQTLTDAEVWRLRTDHAPEYRDLNEMYYRVLLRLNGDGKDQGVHDQKPLKDKLQKLMDAFYRSPCGDLEGLLTLEREVVEETRTLLKSTWEQVKTGEKTFSELRKLLSYALRLGSAVLVLLAVWLAFT